MEEVSPLTRYNRGYRKLCEDAERAVRESFSPPTKLTLSQWAEENAYLSPETSANPGKFEAFKYQNGIMDAVTDPKVKRVTVMKSARVGYTKILDHVIGYFIHQDPSPILVVQPRTEDAEDYSRTEIAPMLRDTPVLAEIVGEMKAKDPDQRIVKRVFRNGASVAFVGANSAAGFRRITARVVAFDEVDAYPSEGAGIEGDQIMLGVKRTETFWNRKIILGSTPLIKDMSRIEASWNASDKRKYHVPCPHCGERQTLKWSNLRWDKDAEHGHLPSTAYFVCEASGCVIEESSKPWMIDNGEWIAENPFTGHAGFHIWSAYSLFPNACWANLVTEFLEVRKKPTEFRTYVNTVWGETWEEKSEKVDAHFLSTRGENYGPQSLPVAILALTAGVDVQGNRLELQVIGWGQKEECWVVDYKVLWGDPAQQDVWVDLDNALVASYHSDSGRELRIKAACIDTGGNHQNQVIQFCKTRLNRRIYPTQGMHGVRPVWPKTVSKTKKNETIFGIGVDTAKDTWYGRFRMTKPGPGYVHFPVGEPYNEDYFAQITSEQVVTRHREGLPYRVWILPPNRRNEVLDTAVLALAAKMSLPKFDSMVEAPRSSESAGVKVSVVVPEIKNPFPVVAKKRTGLSHLLAR